MCGGKRSSRPARHDSDRPDQWRQWLGSAWQLPGFAAAVSVAAPQLAEQVARAAAGCPMPPHRLRRLVEVTIRYLLRWTIRATPFGRFAGVAPVGFGARAAVRWGEAQREVSRPNGELIAEHTARAEQDLAILRSVQVMSNPLGFRRSGTWLLPCARADGDRRWDFKVRMTPPVEAALQATRSPCSTPRRTQETGQLPEISVGAPSSGTSRSYYSASHVPPTAGIAPSPQQAATFAPCVTRATSHAAYYGSAGWCAELPGCVRAATAWSLNVVDKSISKTVAAAHSVGPAASRVFDEVMARIAVRFTRVEPRLVARDFVRALMAAVDRKNCWQLAEAAGHERPSRMQRLLRETVWDADAMAADLRSLVVDGLAHPDAVFVVDETRFLKRACTRSGCSASTAEPPEGSRTAR